MDTTAIFTIVILILSIVLHELAHGYAAFWLGDPTAKLQGRLTLNPMRHIDPVGSVVVPALLYFSQAGMMFGWAKPVPYNPYNLRDQKYGEAKIAAAGPLVNLFIALVFGTLIRYSAELALPAAAISLATYVVYINIILACFNLIPIPPLDGSKILAALLPFNLRLKYENFLAWFQSFGLLGTFLFVFLFINVFSAPFHQLISVMFGLMTGI